MSLQSINILRMLTSIFGVYFCGSAIFAVFFATAWILLQLLETLSADVHLPSSEWTLLGILFRICPFILTLGLTPIPFSSLFRRLVNLAAYLCVFLCFSPILALPFLGASTILALLQQFCGMSEPVAPLYIWACSSAAVAAIGMSAELGVLATHRYVTESGKPMPGCRRRVAERGVGWRTGRPCQPTQLDRFS